MAWQVTAEMVVVPAATPFGPQMVHVLRDGLLPDGVPDDRIQHLLSVGMIRAVGVVAHAPADTGGADTDGPSVPGSPGGDTPPQPEELSEERKAARAKLPADGSLPHHAAGKAVWVEAAVDRGYAYEAANAASKAELVELLKS